MARMLAGGNPPSAMPKTKRIAINEVSDQARLVKAVNSDHITMVTITTYFEPKRSESHPPGTCIAA